MKAKVFISLILVFSFLKYCSAQETQGQAVDEEILKLMKASLTYDQGTLPVTFMLIEQDYKIGGDGLTTKRMHVLMKIVKETGKDFGTISLPYNAYYQDLELIKARTILPDGQTINVSSDVIQDKAPYSGYPLYSDIKIKQMSFARLEPGNFIEYEIAWKDKKLIFDKGYWDDMLFPFGFVTRAARLRITVPSATEVKYYVFKIPQAAPVVTENDGQKTYFWDMAYIFPTHSYEDAIPPYPDIGPRIFFTTIKTWADTASWFRKLFEGQSDYDETIQEKTKSLAGPQEPKTEQEREQAIRKLYAFVQKDVRYVAAELKESIFKPYPAREVFANRYGDCKGKSALLLSMLKAAGITAHYALVKTRASGRQLSDFPSFDFNHCLVAVPGKEGFLFLDPTYAYAAFGELPSSMQATDVFLVTEDGYKFEKMPFLKPEDNATFSNKEIKFTDSRNVTIKDNTTINGTDGASFRLLSASMLPHVFREMIAASLKKQFHGSEIDSLTFSDTDNYDLPLSINLSYHVSNFTDKAGELLLFSLSEDLAASFLPLTASDDRKYPLWFSHPLIVSQKAVINLPGGLKLKSLPSELSLEESFGSYRRKFIQDKDGILTMEEDFTLKKCEISEVKFVKFKSFIKQVAEAAAEKVVLEPQAGPHL